MTLPVLFHNRFGGAIKWLLRDDFTDTLAAGSVNGTPATPGPGTRSVVDTANHLAVAGGLLDFDGTAVNSQDPSYAFNESITRTAGKLLVARANSSAGALGPQVGFGDTKNTNAGSRNFTVLRSTSLYVMYAEGTQVLTGAITASTFYYVSVILRAAGAYYFIKGGSEFTDWTLYWFSGSTNDATVYTFYSPLGTGSNTADLDFIRVPEETWLPTPLAYDTFTDTNGVSLHAHASDTSGPDSQTVTTRAWVEGSGDWDIQTNKANPDGAATAVMDVSEADVVIDCVVSVIHNDGLIMRYTDENTYWHLRLSDDDNEMQIWENDTGWTDRASSAFAIAETDFSLRAICYGTTINGFANSANKASYASATLNQTATKHGILASNTGTKFNDFLVFARDDGYSKLDKWIA